jgi:hypothetical protein
VRPWTAVRCTQHLLNLVSFFFFLVCNDFFNPYSLKRTVWFSDRTLPIDYRCDDGWLLVSAAPRSDGQLPTTTSQKLRSG